MNTNANARAIRQIAGKGCKTPQIDPKTMCTRALNSPLQCYNYEEINPIQPLPWVNTKMSVESSGEPILSNTKPPDTSRQKCVLHTNICTLRI